MERPAPRAPSSQKCPHERWPALPIAAKGVPVTLPILLLVETPSQPFSRSAKARAPSSRRRPDHTLGARIVRTQSPMVKLDLAGRWCGRAARPLGKREVWVAARFHVTRRTTIQSFRRRQAHLLVAAREKVGFDDLTIHDLRHVAASAWIAQDLDVAYVSALLRTRQSIPSRSGPTPTSSTRRSMPTARARPWTTRSATYLTPLTRSEVKSLA